MEEMEFNSDQEVHEKYSKDTCHLWSLMLNGQSENIRFPAEDSSPDEESFYSQSSYCTVFVLFFMSVASSTHASYYRDASAKIILI